jgi:endonuclease/exonuclease/phosphatase (EEP) superfamily protein YafD
LPASFATSPPLDPRAIRVVTWNIHKQADAGWSRDLDRFTKQSDVVLLQEAVLDAPIRRLIDGEGFTWAMASSFELGSADIGVITASRVAPRDVCTLRADEPLLHIPKSTVVAWYALPRHARTLAIANVHAINFTLSLGEYRAQLAALAKALASHRGPLIVAGDFNTWSAGRARVLHDVASRLGLTELSLPANARSRFLGREVDHIYVRGLAPVSARAVSVVSSDHNPVLATLRVVD